MPVGRRRRIQKRQVADVQLCNSHLNKQAEDMLYELMKAAVCLQGLLGGDIVIYRIT